MKTNILTLFILIFALQKSFCQLYDNDQPHSNIKWRQIDGENFRLIYPSTFESTALTLSYQLNSIIHKASEELKVKPKKISIILQTNHINPNGYVQLAPRKSEFNTTPPNAADNTVWLQNLALHEMRHVAQFDKLTGRLHKPFLEILSFALFGLHLPTWFFEGDAVYVETVYSNGGRGRLPSWDMPLRTNLLSGKNYSFDKYIMGSFKDLVPSYYTIGYFLNTHLENTQKGSVKSDILDNMRHHLLRPYNFNKALKKHTGYKSNSLYRATIDTLKKLWQEPIDSSNPHYIQTPKSKYPTSYLLPQLTHENHIFAILQTPTKTSQIVKIRDKKIEKVIYTGQQITPYFDVKGDLIVWDEYRKNARFAKETHQAIHVYNYKTKKQDVIATQSRFYSPVIHPNLKDIAVVKVDLLNNFSIQLIDMESKKMIDSIKMPALMQISQPRFNKDGSKIVVIAIDQKGTNLIEIDLKTKELKELLDWGNQQFERPSYHDQHVVFKAHYQGKDQIYKLNPINKDISILTNESFGAFNPTVIGDSIIYNSYQYNGFFIAQQKIIPQETTSVKSLNNFNKGITNSTLQVDSIDQSTTYTSKKYNPLSHFFNFHSLTISDSNFESFDNYRPGIFWQANDLLNTSQFKIGYEYDLERRKSIYSAEVMYQRYFPKFKLKYENKGELGQAMINGKQDSVIGFDWQQHGVYADINLPFSIFRRNYAYSFGFNFGTYYVKRYNMSIPLRSFNEEIAFPLNYQVYLNRNSLRSKMDLAPKWGQNINITYRHLPFENQIDGNILSVSSNFYFPGLINNHSLQIRLAFQNSSGIYQQTPDIPLVSGFGYFKSPLVKNTMMLNYRFPVAYPDWAIGSVSYIKRLQGLIFSDYQNMDIDKFKPKSFGIGLSADFHLFRYVLPEFNAGTKIIYVNDATASQKIIPTFSFSYKY